MAPRKRTRAEMEDAEPVLEKQAPAPSLLQRIRDMWEFSAVMQFIYLFGKVIKIDDDFDVEDFEEECLKPAYSEKLEEIGLTLLKWISSHRGLTHENWDEYTRRQYLAKDPARNPYGDEEEPKKFRDFDIFQKVRILHQLTVWTFWNPDRVRERMPEHQKEAEQTEWRMEPFGWDSQEREYYVLDDNRMYRRTEPPLPAMPKAKPKSNTIKARAARRRASKRRKTEHDDESDVPNDDETLQLDTTQLEEHQGIEVDTYGGYKWECVAISLNDFNEFLESIKKTRDPNEKELRGRIIEDVLPVIEAAAEKQRRKQERREKELVLMEKMAGAKRSSRLANKAEREKKELEEAEAAQKKASDLAAAYREQEKQHQMEEERRSRMMTREQRIKDREYKRILMEDQIARDAEEQKKIEEGEKRGSERHLRERIEKSKKELEDLESEDDWTFDCSGCGKHGKNYDDGSHSVACERCNVWQHSKCLGIPKSAAEKDDFHFVCQDCLKQEEEEAKRPRIMLKFGHSSPPPQLPLSSAEQHLSAANTPTTADTITVASELREHRNKGNPNTTLHPSQSMSFHDSSSLPQAGMIGSKQHTQQQDQRTTSDDGRQSPPRPVQPTYSDATPLAPANSGRNMFNMIQSTPRPPSAQEHHDGLLSAPRRIPSPVINRPTMSPTQGNPDVGPIAGVPGSSPTAYHTSLFTPHTNGTTSRPSSQEQQINGRHAHRNSMSPRQSFVAQSPNPQHLSGLSPTKQRVNSPLPPPSSIPEKQSTRGMSPPSFNSANTGSFNNSNANNSFRTVSGTPIFPPAEKLAPSPEQINREPVPTPSKQPSPIMISGQIRRFSNNLDAFAGVPVNGTADSGPRQTPSGTAPSPTQRPLTGGDDGERRS